MTLRLLSLLALAPVMAQAQLVLYSLSGTIPSPLASVYGYGQVAAGDLKDVRFRALNTGTAVAATRSGFHHESRERRYHCGGTIRIFRDSIHSRHRQQLFRHSHGGSANLRVGRRRILYAAAFADLDVRHYHYVERGTAL